MWKIKVAIVKMLKVFNRKLSFQNSTQKRSKYSLKMQKKDVKRKTLFFKKVFRIEKVVRIFEKQRQKTLKFRH